MPEDKSIIDYDNIIGRTDVFEELGANLDSLETQLRRMAKEFDKGLVKINVNDTVAIEKQALALRKLELAEEKLRLKKDALANAQKKKIALTNQELIQAQKEKIAQQERIRRAKQLAIIQTQQGNTIKSLRAQLSLVSLDWSKLTEKEIKNGQAAKALSKRKLDLTNQLKRLEKQTGDTRRNVGNYTDSLSKLGKTAARVFVGRSAVDFFRKIVSGVSSLIEANKEGSQSIGELDDSIGKAGNAFTRVAVTILELVAPALIFLIDTATSVLGIFFDLNKGSSDFSEASEELTQKTKALNEEFKKEKSTSDSLFFSLGKVTKGSKEHKEIIDKINTQYGEYLPNLLTEKSTKEEISIAQDRINEGLSKEFLLKSRQAKQLDLFNNKAKTTVQVFDDISKVIGTGFTGEFDLSINEFEDFVAELSKSDEALERFKNQLNDFRGAREGSPLNTEVVVDFVQPTAEEFQAALSNSGTVDLDVTPTVDSKQVDNISTELKQRIDKFSTAITSLQTGTAADDFIRLIEEAKLYNNAIDETTKDIESLQGSIVKYDRTVKSSTSTTKSNTKALKDNTAERLKAIEQLQMELGKIEAENIEDRQERALALEELRFNEEQKLREQNFDSFIQLVEDQESNLIDVYGKNDKRVIAFRDKAGKELLQIEKLTLELGEEQLRVSEENKIKILEDFDKKREERASKAVTKAQELIKKDADDFAKLNKDILKDQQKSIELEEETNRKKRKEAGKKKLEDQKDLSKKIISLTAETSKAIQGIFDQELKSATDAVEAQATAVSNAEARAQAGLENSLKFEQEQLAQKELQRQQAEKRATQAAEALALINLTVAAAQSGDKNAVQTGLVQFGVLKGLIAAIGSFYHGTEDTGTVANPLDSNGGRLAVLHNNERVVTAADNKRLGGMSKEDLVENALRGQAMTDFSQPYMLLGSNHYQQQTREVLSASQISDTKVDFSKLEEEMRQTRRAIEKKPVASENISGVVDNVLHIIRKTQSGRMTRTELIKKRI